MYRSYSLAGYVVDYVATFTAFQRIQVYLGTTGAFLADKVRINAKSWLDLRIRSTCAKHDFQHAHLPQKTLGLVATTKRYPC